MGKRLLGIVGSPRKLGNSELFVKELFRRLPNDDGWNLDLVRLPDLDLRPCRACYQCLFGEGECPQDDDFSAVLQTLIQCDAYVVAAPTYLLAANASLKRFLDRGLSFYGHLDALWGKPAVGAAIAGIDGMEGSTKLNVESFIKLTFGDLRGSEVIYGAMPGEVFLGGGGRAAAERLAEALVSGKKPEDDLSAVCPLCGGDTFRFLSNDQMRCMLCSSLCRYSLVGSKLSLQAEPAEHSLFLSHEDARRHADWLRETKDKFLARRKDLKAVTQEYRDIGDWLRPEKRRESE